ncbi:MAG: hypothetical protein IPJ47_14525 [Anaerolineales bacterium]|jgi:hypothetical protein|nr:hypothetical protein [Anaerolineales bacterium]
MPGELSTVGANNALDGALGRVTQTARTTYAALLTATPTDATTNATMTEYAATGYSRQSVTWAAPSGDPAATSNTNTVTFGPFTAGTGATVTHVALVSSASGTSGDFIYWWAVDTSKTPTTGDSIQIAIGDLDVSLD